MTLTLNQKTIDFWNISFPGFKAHSCSTVYLKKKKQIGCDCIMSCSSFMLIENRQISFVALRLDRKQN